MPTPCWVDDRQGEHEGEGAFSGLPTTTTGWLGGEVLTNNELMLLLGDVSDGDAFPC